MNALFGIRADSLRARGCASNIKTVMLRVARAAINTLLCVHLSVRMYDCTLMMCNEASPYTDQLYLGYARPSDSVRCRLDAAHAPDNAGLRRPRRRLCGTPGCCLDSPATGERKTRHGQLNTVTWIYADWKGPSFCAAPCMSCQCGIACATLLRGPTSSTSHPQQNYSAGLLHLWAYVLGCKPRARNPAAKYGEAVFRIMKMIA